MSDRPGPTVAPARLAAFRILLAVETEGRHADDLLHGAALQKLPQRDRALATTLVMGTLRWQLALDAATAPLLRAGTVLAPEVAIALRLGLFQLWYLDRIPAHAALSESVDLAKVHGFAGMAGLVNAILRKLSRQPAPPPAKAAMLAHPAWLVERWRVLYGSDNALKICEADQQVPNPVVRADSEQAPENLHHGNFLTSAWLLNPGEDPQTHTQLRIQDEGSQLVAEIAAAAGTSTTRVLDACAAPGGKTAILAELLPTAELVAADVSAVRLKTMQRLLPAELASRIQLEQADARDFPSSGPFLKPFDLVLCDVPCSGTGTLARNPEIRLRLRPEQLAQFAQNQLQILRSCWQRVATGGILVYSTCSLEPEENESIIQRFLAMPGGAALIPMQGILAKMQSNGRLTDSGADLLQSSALQGDFLRTVPGVHPCDGFFTAVLQKL